MRFSWQPPQKRCSPARPLIQMSSLATVVPLAVPLALPADLRRHPELVDQLDVEGTLAGTMAANESSACSGISP